MILARIATSFNETRSWLGSHWRGLVAVDALFGAIAAVGAAVAVVLSESVRASGVSVLIGETAICVATLAVALTALAILVGLLDNNYRHLLDAVGGVDEAVEPFQVVATVSCLTTLVAVPTAVLWNILPVALAAGLLALTVWGTVWALWGTVQITNLTAFHGIQRARLHGQIERASEDVAKINERRANG